jgi:hypothetical protein
MFFAVLAPLCAGPTDKRKRLVFDVLKWHISPAREGIIPYTDAKSYIKYLRAIYLPDQVRLLQASRNFNTFSPLSS